MSNTPHGRRAGFLRQRDRCIGEGSAVTGWLAAENQVEKGPQDLFRDRRLCGVKGADSGREINIQGPQRSRNEETVRNQVAIHSHYGYSNGIEFRDVCLQPVKINAIWG